MTQTQSLDTSSSRRSLTTVGMIIWLASETMFFAGLFAAYFTLRANSARWPPPGTELNIRAGAVFTGVLLASSATMHLAGRSAAGRDVEGLTRWTLITILLAAGFIGNQVVEWTTLGFSVSSHQFGSLFYVMTGFHGLHVLGGMAAMGLLVTRVKMAGSVDEATVEAVSAYWHFVDVVWLALFVTIFIIR